jgi:putative SOS response-associated peptidase YedK
MSVSKLTALVFLIVFDIERQFHITPIHDRMTTFLLPKDYAEYLEPTERPPVHLLRILPAEQMEATLVETTPISNRQVSLFDSQ